MLSSAKFFLPLFYFLCTRTNGWLRIVSWVLAYVLPSAFVFFWFSSDDNVVVRFAIFCLAALSIFSIYEIGYIENDSITATDEASPTLRLDEADRAWAASHIVLLSAVRWAIALLMTVTIHLMQPHRLTSTIHFLLVLLLLQFLFILYNRTRSRIGLFIFPALVSIRYFGAAIAIISPNEIVTLLLCMFPVYPLPNLLEWMTKERYGFSRLRRTLYNVDGFRATYYLVLSAAAGLIVVYFPSTFSYCTLIVAGYFALYRSAAYTACRLNNSVKKKMSGWNRKPM